MIRLVIVALVVVAVWIAILQVVKLVKGRTVDWTGVVFCLAFVALAFYLRNVTGMG